MRLTSFTDYSLRVLMYLAVRPGARATIPDVAAAYGISQSHLAKVVHHLGQQGLLTNVRGRGGGFELARPPSSINIGAVVRAAEAEAALVECFDRQTNHCVITPVCGLRHVVREALDAFFAALDRYTLEDVTRKRRQLRNTLEISVQANSL
jgi:Rrf2 family transcriptional regulator, nitric oxide-sensitive transcriptional repressor